MMAESRTVCPHCERLPGVETHADRCPRSRRAQRRLAQQLEDLGRPRAVWFFGPQVVTVGRKRKITYNPGVPFVRQDRGKPWYAGGVPADLDRKTRSFFEKLERTRERLRAREERDVEAR